MRPELAPGTFLPIALGIFNCVLAVCERFADCCGRFSGRRLQVFLRFDLWNPENDWDVATDGGEDGLLQRVCIQCSWDVASLSTS